MAEEKEGFFDRVNKDLVKRYIEEYSNLDSWDAVEQFGKFATGTLDTNWNNIPKMVALWTKAYTLMTKTIDKDNPQNKGKLLDTGLKSMELIKQTDSQAYDDMMDAILNKDTETFKNLLRGSLLDIVAGQGVNLEDINPELYPNMEEVGDGLESNNYTSIEQLQAENAALYEKIGLLEGQVAELAEQLGIQISQPQEQARAGEEKADKARAIYEKDGVKIEVADGLQPGEDQEQELQHGEDFQAAQEEVTEEDLEVAAQEVKDRDAITEDGTVSIILGNSKKITISVEPYIAGDKETQMAQEANDQERIAAQEESKGSGEITDDIAKG